MDSRWELLARDRCTEAVGCRLGADDRDYHGGGFLTTAWQAGNLGHLGVSECVTVGIAADRILETVLACLGTGRLGATVWFDPPLAPICGRRPRQPTRSKRRS